MAKVYLTSYATESFAVVRQELNTSARSFGITEHLSYSGKDLHTSEYYSRNKSILDETCGAGYWAWKPYFILEALKSLSDGDVLFYADAGSLFVQPTDPLVEICTSQRHGLVLFDARPVTNAQFVKRDCFVRMGCDSPQIWLSPMVMATVLVIRKCDASIALLQEWLSYCTDPAIITDDPSISGMPELTQFLQHRHDQSILSVLAARDAIETYRNPTRWGNYLKMPRFRKEGEEVVSPFGLLPHVNGYSGRPQLNSPYGTIFEINRSPNLFGKRPLPLAAYQEQHSIGVRAIAKLNRAARKALGNIRRVFH
jgi:hypothetical protein